MIKKCFLITTLVLANLLISAQETKHDYNFSKLLDDEIQLINKNIWTDHGQFIIDQLTGGISGKEHPQTVLTSEDLQKENLNVVIKLKGNDGCTKLNTLDRYKCLDIYNADYRLTKNFNIKKERMEFKFTDSTVHVNVKKKRGSEYYFNLPYEDLDFRSKNSKNLKTCYNTKLYFKPIGGSKFNRYKNGRYYECGIIWENEGKNIENTSPGEKFIDVITEAIKINHRKSLKKYINSDLSEHIDLYSYKGGFVFEILPNAEDYYLLNNILCSQLPIKVSEEMVRQMKENGYPSDLMDKLILIGMLRDFQHDLAYEFFNYSYGPNHYAIGREISKMYEKLSISDINWHPMAVKLSIAGQTEISRTLTPFKYANHIVDFHHFVQWLSEDLKMINFPISKMIFSYVKENQPLSALVKEIIDDDVSMVIASNVFLTDEKRQSFFDAVIKEIDGKDITERLKTICILATNGHENLIDTIFEKYSIDQIESPYYREFFEGLNLLKQRTLAFCYFEYYDHNLKKYKYKIIDADERFNPKGRKYFRKVAGIPYKVSKMVNPKILEIFEVERSISNKLIELRGDSPIAVKETLYDFFDYASTTHTEMLFNPTQEEYDEALANNAKKSKAFERAMLNYFNIAMGAYAKKEIEEQYFHAQTDWLNSLHKEYGIRGTQIITYEYTQHARGMNDKNIYAEWDRRF